MYWPLNIRIHGRGTKTLTNTLTHKRPLPGQRGHFYYVRKGTFLFWFDITQEAP